MNDDAPSSISLRTSNIWMHLLGFDADKAAKGYYTDSHNRRDVTEYRDEVFLPRMKKYEVRMSQYSGTNMEIKTEPVLPTGEKGKESANR